MMTLEQTIKQIEAVVDSLLVQLAEEPESRYLITLPPLTEGELDGPVMDCQEYHYGIARLREVITYKYLLKAFRTKQLAVSRESLAACVRNFRKSPVIDYYDLGDYHEFAFYYYKKSGNEKKARRHLLSCYEDRGRAILSCGKTFDSKDLLMLILKDHARLKSFLLYVVHYVLNDFDELQPYLKRSQYLLLERALILAVKLFAENGECAAELRACVYQAQSLYYAQTNRAEEANKAKAACQKLGVKKDYAETFEAIVKSQSKPSHSDERFLDYLLYRNYLEDYQIYPMDAAGNVNLDAPYDYFILAKDGRSNFMDTFYRPLTDALHFKKVYDQAERGVQTTIREVVRCYREGDGVTTCELAAKAWEQQIL